MDPYWSEKTQKISILPSMPPKMDGVWQRLMREVLAAGFQGGAEALVRGRCEGMSGHNREVQAQAPMPQQPQEPQRELPMAGLAVGAGIADAVLAVMELWASS